MATLFDMTYLLVYSILANASMIKRGWPNALSNILKFARPSTRGAPVVARTKNVSRDFIEKSVKSLSLENVPATPTNVVTFTQANFAKNAALRRRKGVKLTNRYG